MAYRKYGLISALAAALAVLWAGDTGAHEFRVGDLDIIHPWTRPVAADADNAAVYLTVVNHNTVSDRLVGGRTIVAGTVRLALAGDAPAMPRAGRVAPIDVTFSQPLALRPGSAYVRLSGLRRALARGDSFVLTLVFARAGAVDVTVVVQDTPDH